MKLWLSDAVNKTLLDREISIHGAYATITPKSNPTPVKDLRGRATKPAVLLRS